MAGVADETYSIREYGSWRPIWHMIARCPLLSSAIRPWCCVSWQNTNELFRPLLIRIYEESPLSHQQLAFAIESARLYATPTNW